MNTNEKYPDSEQFRWSWPDTEQIECRQSVGQLPSLLSLRGTASIQISRQTPATPPDIGQRTTNINMIK